MKKEQKIFKDPRDIGKDSLVFSSKKHSSHFLLEIYKNILLPRMIEEKMLLLLRQGKISKWFSGIGQEAIAVGATMAMEKDEYICPLHRNLGVFTTRHVPLKRLFAQFMGKSSGYTKGRDRSFHFGTLEHHIIGMISHLGPQMALADGLALGEVLSGRQKVSLVFTGEGGTSEGDFHEALNVASVWNLPVIFLIENNGYGLSTPTTEQFKCKYLIDRKDGYAMEGTLIEGNNILQVYETISSFAAEIRKNPRPVFIECITFRMRGHEEASGTKYVPPELFEYWEKKDPVREYEKFLKKEKILTENYQEELRHFFQKEMDDAFEQAQQEPGVSASVEVELKDVYAPSAFRPLPPSGPAVQKRMIDSIREALDQAMERNHQVILMGQDIAEYGGVFKATQGLSEKYGRHRVRNTPLCESAILGTALGLSIQGYKSVVEMQFADFVTCGFNQIINNMAKLHYRWGCKADVVIRMPTGAGTGAGPFHSQSNEAWFVHTPGLKVVYPAFAHEAKGLLLAAIEDSNPVLFFEHKALYRSEGTPVPTGYFTLPLGQADLFQEGEDLSIITYGWGVHWAREILQKHPEISADLLNLRTLLPWDKEAVGESVRKTGKVLVLHEDTLTGGVGGEIAAYIGEHLFESLDGPVVRVASLDTPIPMSSALESQFLGRARLEEKLLELWRY